MNYRYLVLFLVIITAISGCANHKEEYLSLDNVIQAMESEGLQLTSIDQNKEGFLTLNNLEPFEYTINYSSKVDQNKKIFLYIFDSEESMIDGQNQFRKHLETTKLTTFPLIFEKKNILIIYFSPKEADSQLENLIDSVLQKL